MQPQHTEESKRPPVAERERRRGRRFWASNDEYEEVQRASKACGISASQGLRDGAAFMFERVEPWVELLLEHASKLASFELAVRWHNTGISRREVLDKYLSRGIVVPPDE